MPHDCSIACIRATKNDRVKAMWCSCFFAILPSILFFCCLPSGQAFELKPEHVAVVYNIRSPHGKELAETYVKLRNVPQGNLVALDCSENETITREEFEETIRQPLRDVALSRGWWMATGRANDPMVARKIFAIVLMSGMPMKVDAVPVEPNAPNDPKSKSKKKPLPPTLTDASAVDSDLAMLAFDDVPTQGMVQNVYYQRDEEFVGAGIPYFLVTRIDAPSKDICLSMMYDAIDVEKVGLWGWLLVDRGGPYAEGDAWMDNIARDGAKSGIPLSVDEWGETLPLNYPANDNIGIYFGWYAGGVNGPFLEKSFRFKRGAVAVHLHSYSASTVRVDNQCWVGPLLSKGAIVTVGNVYEPYLGTSHHLDTFFNRLLRGYTVAEAGAMSISVWSWQNVVFGDPLYRPFDAMVKERLIKTEQDKYFQAWHVARKTWGDKPQKMKNQLELATQRPASRLFFAEALGNLAMQEKDNISAERNFSKALASATKTKDRMRLRMQLAEIQRRKGDKKQCLIHLKTLQGGYPDATWTPAVLEWQNRLEPPPPTPPPPHS
ncbi:MAG: TIGR03790 family protein [Akkermansia sp.]